MTPEELKTQRAKLGMTQPQLASALSMTRDGISSMEQGRRPIRRTTELAVAQLLILAKRESGKSKRAE